jgi:DNA-binding transcriptional MerR regulator
VSELYSIGKLAKLTGRSVHTIRWYEAQGLIPNVERDSGGRRLYHPDHVEHLVFLEKLRRTGMSIAAMRELSALALQGWRTLDERRELLRAHRTRVETDIQELRAALGLIDAKLAYYDEWMAKKKRPPAPAAWSGKQPTGNARRPARTNDDLG